MTTLKKIGKYYYKINRNKKRTRISERKYFKLNRKVSVKQRKSKRKKHMKGGDIDKFFLNYTRFKAEQKDTGITEIGRGGFGTVYVDTAQQESVFKIPTVTCEQEKEIQIYNDIKKQEEKKGGSIDTDTVKCKLIRLIESETKDGKCIMEITKAHNPDGEQITIQPLFGNKTLEKIYEGRGKFLGVDQLIAKGFFTTEDLKGYIKDLAIVMARFHFKLEFDGIDIELFLSKKSNEEKDSTIIYIGDFDQVKSCARLPEDEKINKLEWCLMAVEYFPLFTKEGKEYSYYNELVNIFKAAYIEEAKIHGEQLTADTVLNRFKS